MDDLLLRDADDRAALGRVPIDPLILVSAPVILANGLGMPQTVLRNGDLATRACEHPVFLVLADRATPQRHLARTLRKVASRVPLRSAILRSVLFELVQTGPRRWQQSANDITARARSG